MKLSIDSTYRIPENCMWKLSTQALIAVSDKQVQHKSIQKL